MQLLIMMSDDAFKYIYRIYIIQSVIHTEYIYPVYILHITFVKDENLKTSDCCCLILAPSHLGLKKQVIVSVSGEKKPTSQRLSFRLK